MRIVEPYDVLVGYGIEWLTCNIELIFQRYILWAFAHIKYQNETGFYSIHEVYIQVLEYIDFEK